MSVRIQSSFQKSFTALTALGAEERPLMAVKITPISAAGVAPNYHLALGLDVSGSMEGPRITAVKTTMGLLLDALPDGYVLTIISYESAAHVLARATVVDSASRATLRDEVDGLHADGGTNLEAALVALRDVATAPDVPPVDAVFVLTDGHINQGLTAASGLTRLLTAAIPAGTPVYTLGFGADHNARMLRDMALRTRGSYTYADAAELIPATIADIISGLQTEVGRGARLILPTGWECLELTAEAGSAEFTVGVLVADKDQWVVLRGPAGPLTAADMPPLSFVWRSRDGVEHTEVLGTYADFDPLMVEEQFCRCRVATVQTAVQDLLESGRLDEARAALAALGAELDANPAKDRTFVISLRAQVDEMVDALGTASAFMTPLRAGLPRVNAGGWVPAAAPALGPILSRMASNTAALGVQRGALSHINSTEAPSQHGSSRTRPSGITHTFTSPVQQAATDSMRTRYTQISSAAAHEEEEAAAFDAAVVAAVRAAAIPSPVSPPPSRRPALVSIETTPPPPQPGSPTTPEPAPEN